MRNEEEWKRDWKKPSYYPDSRGVGHSTKYGWWVSNPARLYLGSYTDIGRGTNIFCKSHKVIIEQGVQIGGNCLIYTEDTQGGRDGEVHIKKGAKIGSHCTLLPGAVIGENATIEAYCIIKDEVPDGITIKAHSVA